MNTSEVMHLDEEELRLAIQDAKSMDQDDRNRRKKWLRIGNVLAKGRAMYPADREFGAWAREHFPMYKKESRSAAIWWARELSNEDRAFCEAYWPTITHPVNIRDMLRKHRQEMADEDADNMESLADPVGSRLPTGTISPEEPENAENPPNSPTNEPESLPEIRQNPVDGKPIRKNNPLVVAKLKMEDVITLMEFYPDDNCKLIIYAISRKGSAQRKWLESYAELIRSGKIGQVNDLPVGFVEGCKNARIIHRALPKRFADQWHFGDGKIEKLKELLEDAPKLYALGEQIKDCESPSKTIEQAFKLWATMSPKSEPERPPAPPAPVIVQAIVAEDPEPDATPPDQQQTIRVCGKQFWPPSEYCKMTYSQVWGVALYVKLTYMQMVHAGHESPDSVIVHMMQSARALRLGNREFGSMYHNILSSMMGRVAQIQDPELTQWPTNGTGKPPEYEA